MCPPLFSSAQHVLDTDFITVSGGPQAIAETRSVVFDEITEHFVPLVRLRVLGVHQRRACVCVVCVVRVCACMCVCVCVCV